MVCTKKQIRYIKDLIWKIGSARGNTLFLPQPDLKKISKAEATRAIEDLKKNLQKAKILAVIQKC